MTIMIKLGIFFLNVIYFFIKLFPINKNKITFISRQSNTEPLDFKLLKEELIKQNDNLKIVELNKRLEKGFFNRFKYCFHMFRQMYHIATSKVVILDSYCIPVCVLRQKKKLVCIQMWHALGAFKKFGYSALDTKDGRSSKIAKLMHMHRNYDYIFTSSKYTFKYFKEAFNAETNNMILMSLPRVDYLKSEIVANDVKLSFYKSYDKLDSNKKMILYCPTSRKNKSIKIDELVNAVDFNKYNLIINYHNNKNLIYIDKDNYYDKNEFSGLQLLHVADYVITDYSAIVFEAAVANKPVYFYNYDFDEYNIDRGFYINYLKEMPGIISGDIKKILKDINNKKYNMNILNKFLNKYVENTEKCTEKCSLFILKNMK